MALVEAEGTSESAGGDGHRVAWFEAERPVAGTVFTWADDGEGERPDTEI